jgi:hypothetical protein
MIVKKTINGITISAEIDNHKASECGFLLNELETGNSQITIKTLSNAQTKMEQHLLKMIDEEFKKQ